jgi:hypothetical protein
MSQANDLLFKNIDGYRQFLRENARAMWTGEWDFFDFYTGMQSTINRGFRQAWEEGMSKYGLKIDDQNTEERARMLQEINKESTHIEGVADFIDSNSKLNGGKLNVCMQRIEQWVAAYTRIRQLATAMAAKDKPLIWTLGAAEHCKSCLKLAGKVKRGSYWKDHVTPKDWDKLDCRKGCLCDLLPTNEPLSKGPLPKLP